MKQFLLFSFSFLLAINLSSQIKKVAIFDPVGIDNKERSTIVREVISTNIAEHPNYVPVERALISKVLEENEYQQKGLVDESQVSELGKQMGADYVCVSVIKPLENNFFITGKLVDVNTATVIIQKYVQTSNGTTDFFEKIEILSDLMFKSSNSHSLNPKEHNYFNRKFARNNILQCFKIDEDRLKEILDDSNIGVNSIISTNPVHIATITSNKKCLELLLERRAEVTKHDVDVAVVYASTDIVEIYTTRYPELIESKHLLLAIEYEKEDAVKLLVKRIPNLDCGAIHAAITRENLDIIEFLHEKGASLTASFGGKTPISLAEELGNKKIISYIKKKTK